MRVIHHMAGRGLSGDDATFVTSGEMSKATEDRPLREEGLLAGSEARSPRLEARQAAEKRARYDRDPQFRLGSLKSAK
ncbi:hypothetical protein [Bradyrhizobium sp. USDA 4506]